MVQWLRFRIPSAGGLVGKREHLRVCMPQLRPGAAKYINKINNFFKNKRYRTIESRRLPSACSLIHSFIHKTCAMKVLVPSPPEQLPEFLALSGLIDLPAQGPTALSHSCLWAVSHPHLQRLCTQRSHQLSLGFSGNRIGSLPALLVPVILVIVIM